jgi:SAM-dependent methyltransferase
MSQDTRLYASGDVWDQDMQLGQINLVRALLDFWPPGISSALDAGCGDGKLTQVLASSTNTAIVGLDSSAEALARLALPHVLGDITAIPFSDASFDLAISTDTLEHLPDDIHDKAWAELFRVASRYVLVAVPFREELLDGTACCSACGQTYHVNWHQRRYDFADIHSRAPMGWRIEASIISGEKWSSLLPTETRFRRLVLNQWSGWENALCPHCGEAGTAPDTSAPLSSLAASALGEQIYTSLKDRRVWRSHSEILTLFSRVSEYKFPTLPRPSVLSRASTCAEPTRQQYHKDLINYPQVAVCVRGIDGSAIIQFPVYEAANCLHVKRVDGSVGAILVSIEDGLGMLFNGVVLAEGQPEASLTLPRWPVPATWGVLLRTGDADSIAFIQLGTGMPTIWLVPDSAASFSYYRHETANPALFIQVTDEVWFDDSLMLPSDAVDKPALDDLFDRMENLTTLRSILLRDVIVQHTQEADAKTVRVQNLEAERAALLDRVADAERLSVDVQNLRAERDALLMRAREADALTVRVQNLEAERAALLDRVADAERLSVDVQNLKAERDALLDRALEADMLAVRMQNLGRERDMKISDLQLQLKTRSNRLDEI